MKNDKTILRLAKLAGLSTLTAALLAACAVGPDYKRPEAATPAAFKEAPTLAAGEQAGTWKPAEPADAGQRGEWWKVFGDPALDALEQQALDANQNLKAAAARVQEARAATRAARSAWFPSLDAGFGPTREGVSSASQFQPQGSGPINATLWRAQGTVSYEADLFGSVSRNVEASRADAAQSEALFQSVRLALQADVAQNYFELRQLDSDQDLYRRTVALREESLKLTQRRFSEGDIDDLDVSRAKNELASAQADAVGVARRRAASEHALAILLGKAPADFGFKEAPIVPVTLKIPPGLPSALLERRPDVAAAERAMAAANARIGLAKSAYFPKLNISGAFGYEASTLGDLFMWSSRTFLLGPFAGTALTLPLFDGGRRSAGVQQARASYEEQVANYRQQVLVAFREVEDNLSDLRLLDDQIRAQGDAVSASQRAAKLSRTQYQEGQIAYLDVIDSERTVLQSQLQANQLTGAQAVSTVNLIRALGGGWGTPQAAAAPVAASSAASSATQAVAQR
ncbi:efflux transporter outer membrane subunit [Burkholderia perseverans]|uniref:efflux transporter outer membrane subunit n=1 Tax=Burkholderia perseverans TaxID=2615214 RepID=UPI001FEF3FCC|nr:efflux transporter outer membrane subunit [Burkholderia perseverans]